MRQRTIIKHLFGAALSALLLPGLVLSCSKAGTEPERAQSEGVRICPEFTIETAAPVLTRGAITSTSFPSNSTFSIWVCEDSTFNQFNLKSRNICVTVSGGSLSYSFDGSSSGFSDLFMKMQNGLTIMDIYAYAPFISGVSRLDSIPFTLSNQYDLMYAEQNAVADSTNKGKDVTGTAAVNPSFTFHHALSLLEFKIRAKHKGSTITPSQIWLKAGADSTKIYTKGVFNALTGAVTGNTPGTANMSISNNSFSTAYTSYYFLLVPTEVKGDNLDVGLVLDGIGGENSGLNCFTILRSQLRHGTSDTYGFQPGCKYTVTVEIDNYVHFSGVTVDDSWAVENMTERLI